MALITLSLHTNIFFLDQINEVEMRINISIKFQVIAKKYLLVDQVVSDHDYVIDGLEARVPLRNGKVFE